MRILRVEDRFFLVSSDSDYEDAALKLLNELRNLEKENLKPGLFDFIAKITDEMDGEQAIQLLPRLFDAEVIAPEVI